MASYTQAHRHIAVSSPLGPDDLLLRGFTGREGLSELYRFRLDLAAEHQTPVPFERVLGEPIGFRLELEDGGQRPFGGICSVVAETGRDESFAYYQMEVVPDLWLLTRRAQSRIFQQATVPDILRQALVGLKTSFELRGEYYPRDYCVQYRETDFAFVSRLMEEEGIFYFFRHAADGPTMVVADTPASHPELKPKSRVEFEREGLDDRAFGRITGWEKVQELRSGRVTLWDHCFEVPHDNLAAAKKTQDEVQVGRVAHRLSVGKNDRLELYDYPGTFAQRFDGIDPSGRDRPADLKKLYEDNQRTAGIRMQEEAARGLTIRGEGACRALAAGHWFTLARHFNADGAYVLVSVEHEATLAGELRSGMVGELGYKNRFTCMPTGIPFRPRRDTPRPVIQGAQTAVVVGPPGEEIFTDKYGRVKVKFHWDRQGKADADASCWIRVAQFAAGGGFGSIHIPRVGQEVVVQFEEGDPDRPLVTGCVYNPGQMPPFPLPAQKMISGFRSNTYPGGGGMNEISVDDSKGKERMFINAQYNQDAVVGNNRTAKVGVDSTEQVGNNVAETIGNDKTVTIGNNVTKTVASNKTESIGANKKVDVAANHTESIGSNMSVSVGANKTETVSIATAESIGVAKALSVGSAYAITVGVAMNTMVGVSSTEQVGVFKSVIVGGKLELRCGASRIVMESGGKVTIEGTEFLFSASGDVKINGSVIDLN